MVLAELLQDQFMVLISGTFIITAVQKILISGGGHKMAAGFSIKEEKLKNSKIL